MDIDCAWKCNSREEESSRGMSVLIFIAPIESIENRQRSSKKQAKDSKSGGKKGVADMGADVSTSMSASAKVTKNKGKRRAVIYSEDEVSASIG